MYVTGQPTAGQCTNKYRFSFLLCRACYADDFPIVRVRMQGIDHCRDRYGPRCCLPIVPPPHVDDNNNKNNNNNNVWIILERGS